uniref:Uncharacterized protein n=1 Tax=Strigamia maritima TaxID=126957 RepID=T1IQN2_STRMM
MIKNSTLRGRGLPLEPVFRTRDALSPDPGASESLIKRWEPGKDGHRSTKAVSRREGIVVNGVDCNRGFLTGSCAHEDLVMALCVSRVGTVETHEVWLSSDVEDNFLVSCWEFWCLQGDENN